MLRDLSGVGSFLCFGGPYSNLQALRAMHGEADRLGIPPGRVICTGDVVAYCAHPNETVALIREWGCHVVAGNCEENLAARVDDCGCGFEEGSACDRLSRGWYGFADAVLEEDHRAWMAALPRFLAFELGGLRIRVIHGGVQETARFVFPGSTAEEKLDEWEMARSDVVVAGHCGVPFIERVGGGVWFNPGVIGMPANDGTRDGWYGLMTPVEDAGDERGGGLTFSTHRLCHDAEGAANALQAKGFAPAYAEALRSGLWPSEDVLPPADRARRGVRLEPLTMLLESGPVRS